MSDQALAPTAPKRSLVATLAAQYDMEPQPFLDAVSQTVMPSDRQVSNAQIAAFLMVCNEYGLNPFVKEIHAFPTKSGGIQPIVGVDGWLKMINQHPQYAGMDIEMKIDEKSGKPISCTCIIYRKDRDHAVPITEYYDECYRNTDPWNKMPKRSLRHKAIKEAGRYNFGFAGIMDEDEARDAINITDQSTVMERSTATKTETLKEKLQAKKEAKATEAPKAPETPPVAPVEVPKAPEATTIEPARPATVVLVSEEQRKQFITAVTDRATALGVTEADAKIKMREMLFNLGFTKFAEVPVSRFQDLLEAVKSWGA